MLRGTLLLDWESINSALRLYLYSTLRSEYPMHTLYPELVWHKGLGPRYLFTGRPTVTTNLWVDDGTRTNTIVKHFHNFRASENHCRAHAQPLPPIIT